MKASVLSSRPISEEVRARIRDGLRPLASRVEGNDYWIGPETLIRSARSDRAIGVRLLFGLPHVDEMSIGERLHFEQAFGVEPVEAVGLMTFCQGEHEPRALGRCLLSVARDIDGIVCFCGALDMPHLGFLRRARPPTHIAQQAATARAFADLPGRIRAIPYEAVEGSLRIAHYADATFLAAWLARPEFHLVG